VRDTINRLVELQQTDQDLGRLAAELEALAQATAAAERALDAARKDLEEHHQRTQEARAHVHRLEMDLQECETGIEKTTVALNTASNNKEYQGLLLKIGTLQAKAGKLEEEILEDMERVEEHESAEAASQARVKEAEGGLGDAESAREDRRSALEAELEESKVRRGTMAGEIPEEQLRLYERIRGGNLSTGTAVAEVHDEYCQACQMKITPQQLTQLVSGHKIVLCRTCQRILVYAP
jgi:predicted  nucleic acid-binding Zn-ribbon protein